MDTLRALELRHSVRSYKDTPLTGDVLTSLQTKIDEINKKAGLHIQLVLNSPKAFDSFLAHYGKFENVQNYFAMVGPKGAAEEIGYYGQELVLYAQQLGLNTCWVGGTHGKDKNAYEVKRGEKVHILVPVGFGKTQGNPHRSKPLEAMYTVDKAVLGKGQDLPDWFRAGVKAAALAPTALNKQPFTLSLEAGDKVGIKMGTSTMPKIDKGIVKYNFEVGAASAGHTVKWA